MKIKKEELTSPGASANRVVASTTITGNITSESDFRFEGKLIGDITVKGRFVMGKGSEIEGNINCTNGDISGSFKGNIVCSQNLCLRSGAYIEGKVFTTKFIVEEGVYFDAICKMTKEGESVENNGKK